MGGQLLAHRQVAVVGADQGLDPSHHILNISMLVEKLAAASTSER